MNLLNGAGGLAIENQIRAITQDLLKNPELANNFR